MPGRIRTLKPEWLEDEKLGKAGDAARVLSAGLILLADDYGNGRAALGYIAAHVWTYELEREPRETLDKAERALASLEAIGYLAFYEASGERFYRIVNWERHQRVDKPGKPHVPGFRETLGRDSRDPRDSLAPDLRPPTSDLDLDPDREPRAHASGPTPEDSGATPELDPVAETEHQRTRRELVRLWPELREDIEGQLSLWVDAYPGVDLVQLAREAKAKARASGGKVERPAALLGRWFQRAWNERQSEKTREFEALHAARKRNDAAERRLTEQLTGPRDAKPIGEDVRRLLAVVKGGNNG